MQSCPLWLMGGVIAPFTSGSSIAVALDLAGLISLGQLIVNLSVTFNPSLPWQYPLGADIDEHFA